MNSHFSNNWCAFSAALDIMGQCTAAGRSESRTRVLSWQFKRFCSLQRLGRSHAGSTHLCRCGIALAPVHHGLHQAVDLHSRDGGRRV